MEPLLPPEEKEQTTREQQWRRTGLVAAFHFDVTAGGVVGEKSLW
jgi:hypothetical protein